MLRPGPTLRAALPEQRHEREEVRKRVEGRAVVHRIRPRGGIAVDPGGGAGGRRAGGAVRPGSRRRGNSKTGAAAFCYLLRLSQATFESHFKRDIDMRGRHDGVVIEQRRDDGSAGATATTAITTTSTAAGLHWRQGCRQQEHRDVAELRLETGGPRCDALVPGGLSDDGGHVAGADGRSELVPLVLVRRQRRQARPERFDKEQQRRR